YELSITMARTEERLAVIQAQQASAIAANSDTARSVRELSLRVQRLEDTIAAEGRARRAEEAHGGKTETAADAEAEAVRRRVPAGPECDGGSGSRRVQPGLGAAPVREAAHPRGDRPANRAHRRAGRRRSGRRDPRARPHRLQRHPKALRRAWE